MVTRNEVQLDITRDKPIDDNAFTAELANIVESSFNIHDVGTHDKRFCFKLPENPESKLKAWARNDRAFDPQSAAVPGLFAVRRDQEYLKQVLNYVLKTPDGTSEPPSQPVVLDPNWQRAPWANLPHADQPAGWTERGKPVLIVLPPCPGPASVIARSLSSRNVAKAEKKNPLELVLNPPVFPGSSFMDWSRYPDLMEASYEWGRKTVETLRGNGDPALAAMLELSRSRLE